ncbi:MAG TPA: hypothetical protein P5572_00190 [Phycisphaerae bacterium]|nr:hypothetical protein [Phycisphaerae bacterium]
MPRTPRHRRRALTLVESLMAAMVLLVVVVAVSQALLAGQMQVYDAAHRARAIELAEALMDEVLRLPYADADTDNETTRATFDDLDDFDGYSESGTLRDAAGTAYPSEYQVFTRTVAVSTTSKSVSGFGAAFDGLEVTVTVSDGTGLTWTLQEFVPEPQS